MRILPAHASSEFVFGDCLQRGPTHDSFHFYLSAESFLALGVAPHIRLVCPGPGEVDLWLLGIARRLVGMDGETPPRGVEVNHLCLAAISRVVERHSDLSAAPLRAPLKRGGLAGWQLKRVLAHINEDLTRSLAVTELAALCRLSPHHFARAFRQSTGQPPHAYVVGQRLAAAKRLLNESQLSITEIAFTVGYAESGHLARAFKRVHGVAPAEYRRRV